MNNIEIIKDSNAMVSIITPCYNSSKFIAQTIDSILQQTFLDWELLIVDDCSTDNSLEIIYSLSGDNSKIVVIPLKERVGAAEARNIALRKANGRYIAFLDSDDIWFPNKLERQLSFMISSNYAFSFTAYNIINENGKTLKRIITAPKRIGYYQYLRNTIIGCLTVIIDRQVVGYFEMPPIKSSHDMALWLLILKRGFIAYGLNEILASYRIVRTSNTASKAKAALDVWHVYRKIEKISFLFSFICFVGYTFNAIKKRIL
jgi:teichuronic acid biosynthesis glycosyltransferase TuaG